MSDQGLSHENTPAVAGPNGTGEAEQHAQPEGDYQKRYVDLQAEYTRAAQENAEFRRQQELYDLLLSTDDTDTRRQVAERLGYVLDEEPDPDLDPDDEDPFSRYNERLDRLETTLTEREQAEADAQYAQQLRGRVDEALDALPGLDKSDQDWVLAYAINALPATADGMPDIAQAHQAFVDRENERQRKWAAGKRAPHISPNGQAATEVPNLDNRQERIDWMTRKVQEGEQAAY